MSEKAPLRTEVNNKDNDDNTPRHSTYGVPGPILSSSDTFMPCPL